MLADYYPAVYINKETLAKVLFCEFYEIFKNTFFTEHIQATASGSGLPRICFAGIITANFILLYLILNLK